MINKFRYILFVQVKKPESTELHLGYYNYLLGNTWRAKTCGVRALEQKVVILLDINKVVQCATGWRGVRAYLRAGAGCGEGSCASPVAGRSDVAAARRGLTRTAERRAAACPPPAQGCHTSTRLPCDPLKPIKCMRTVFYGLTTRKSLLMFPALNITIT